MLPNLPDLNSNAPSPNPLNQPGISRNSYNVQSINQVQQIENRMVHIQSLQFAEEILSSFDIYSALKFIFRALMLTVGPSISQ